jgi:hypothetical protein
VGDGNDAADAGARMAWAQVAAAAEGSGGGTTKLPPRPGHTDEGALADYEASVSALCLDGLLAAHGGGGGGGGGGGTSQRPLSHWTVELRNPANVRFLRPADPVGSRPPLHLLLALVS